MHFVMKISKLCNLRCRYCYEYEDLGRRDRMPLERLEPFFASVADWWRGHPSGPRLTFVLHGGEPLLLPDEYIRGFVERLRRHLAPAGVPHDVSVQTNLTRIDDRRIALLEELRISLGISLDVFGGQRVYGSGRDSQERVLGNLQHLFDTGAADRLGVGAISVLHRENVMHAVRTYEFYRQLGLSYRILPIFSLAETLPGMRRLTLTHQQVLAAFKDVATAQFASDSQIVVYPLFNFLTAAVNRLLGVRQAYDPRQGEWALIVNTNGDAYNHAEAYSPEGLIGNVYEDTLSEIMNGDARHRVTELRLARAAVCDDCPHGQSCSRLPIVEALPSERSFTPEGRLECTIARPMIDFMLREIEGADVARKLVEHQRDRAVAALTPS